MRRGFDDPPKLAASAKNEEEATGHCLRARDEIKAFPQDLPETLWEERWEVK